MELQPDLLYVIVFGPGFGESIVIRPPGQDARWLFVDCCYNKKRVPAVDLLEEQGCRWGCAIFTHSHEDHGRGFDEIITRAGSGFVGCADPLIIKPELVRRSSDWNGTSDDITRLMNGRLEATIRAIKAKWQDEPETKWEMEQGDTKSVGELHLKVLHPDKKTAQEASTSPNRISTPVLVEWKDVQILLGADLPGSEWENLPECFDPLNTHDLLKVPHHGSVQNISPRYAKGVDSSAFWITTPYNRGKGLPRFEDNEGAEKILNNVNEFHLTNRPVSMDYPKEPHRAVTRGNLQVALSNQQAPVAVGGIQAKPLSGGSPATNEYSSYVALGFKADGEIDHELFGKGSLTVRK